MNEERLTKLINDFNPKNLTFFLRDKCINYAEILQLLPQYDDERFNAFQKLGEIKFDNNDRLVVVTAKVCGDLSERSGKKAQYDKAKKILKELLVCNAGFFIYYDNNGNFRFSLVYAQYEGTKVNFNNFRRFTYFIDKQQTNNTFKKRVGECDFISLEKIKDAFSVEKVNKEFYGEIAKYYYRLTDKTHKELVLPSVGENDGSKYEEFAVRLIGRIIFCWFLKHKSSANRIPLIPKAVLSSDAVDVKKEYYHLILEKLFFEVMNKQQGKRTNDIDLYIPNHKQIPFLNGGLFEAHNNDFYKGTVNNNLKISPQWFKEFFVLLERYNFTIDENSTVDAEVSVDPEMLGRIFENLLAEIVPETGETARKATGSYYTPRVIVDYMVEQSLKQYLVTKTSLTEDIIDSLLSYEVDTVDITDSEKTAVVKALKEIKVIDPACGSGAFPMGILHRILLVLEKVDPNLEIWRKLYLSTYHPVMRKIIEDKLSKGNEQYIRKLTIIQDSIYGVDIQPIAVEIAKLRCFLSLVVDELVFDNEDNRGIEALPNLEFKFVAANTLIGLPPIASQSAFGVTDLVEKLKDLRERYLRSFGEEKLQIEKEFKDTQQKLYKENVQWALSSTIAKQLSDWDPFSYESCSWFEPAWMFGKDGFDIVIANPPYLGEKGHKEIFQKIKQGTLKKYYIGKMDLFYFFFHLALNLSDINSQIAFITTNYYPTASSAIKLRKDFKERSIIRRLINFNELKIFESALGQHNMVSIISKGQDENAKVDTCITCRTGVANMNILHDILAWADIETTYYNLTQNDLYEGDECYMRITGSAASEATPIQHILNKVQTQGHKLILFCNINQGIVTGADKLSNRHIIKYGIKGNRGDGIFVLDSEEIADLRIPCADKKILKPWFKNSDILKWKTQKETHENVIYLDRHNKEIYENYERHLTKYKAVLAQRREVINGVINWWQLQWPRDINFCGPKVVVPQRSYKNTFAYNDIPWYASADVYFITEKDEGTSLKYCLALLNSKLYYLWLYHKGKRKGEMLELYQVPLSEIPIKKISKNNQEPFIELVAQILDITKDEDYLSNPAKKAKVKDLEREIDILVYELYELTPEEIAIVEGNNK